MAAGKTQNSKKGSADKVEDENKEDRVQTSMDVESSCGPQSGGGTVRLEETMTQ